MNIFVLSLQFIECAMFHCDQHVVKMILESAQMLCTVCVLTGLPAPYAAAHKKHPCTLWALHSLSNWRWLRDLATALNEEFKYRYKKDINHKSFDVICQLSEPKIEDKGLTPFALAMPDEFRDPDPVKAYRNYYAGAKHKFATWKLRGIPQWYIDLRSELGGDAENEVAALLKPGNLKQKRLEAKELKNEIMKKSREEIKRKRKSSIPKVTKKTESSSEVVAAKDKTTIPEKSSKDKLIIANGVKTRKMVALELANSISSNLTAKPLKRSMSPNVTAKRVHH